MQEGNISLLLGLGQLLGKASDYEADGLLAELGRVAEQLQLGYPALEFLGPSEAPISMVRRRRRFHLILKGTSLDLLREAAE